MIAQDRTIALMLCGDVMTGRGMDQVLPHPSPPALHEAYATSAMDYVDLAERANGPVPRPMSFASIWGDALALFDRMRPDLRIVNLETAVTRSGTPWPKGINYRMNPLNVPTLTAARIDCCVLANNHVLDWDRAGLTETLNVLHDAGLATAGAGHDAEEAAAPAILPVPGKGRVLVYALACPSSGVPDEWSAAADRPGVNFLPRPSAAAAAALSARIGRDRAAGDIVVVSLHWGGNWGYDVPQADVSFAHGLVEGGAVDVVYGHSSHHAKAMEVFRRRPILYGCGDFLNDYEGIAGREAYRGDLVMAYLVRLDTADRHLVGVDMLPFRIRNFRLGRADADEARWLMHRMDRECRRYGGGVGLDGGILSLSWR